jgi:hypothetical protein
LVVLVLVFEEELVDEVSYGGVSGEVASVDKWGPFGWSFDEEMDEIVFEIPFIDTG